MARILFANELVRIMPPWLQRTYGKKLLESIGESVDALVARTVEGVKLRFPGWDPDAIDEAALTLIGRERRMLRGIGEPAATYAARLRTWWDAHRLRGGPYALLEQLEAYFEDTYDVRRDVVSQAGTRYWMDADGVVTRDFVVWDGDGTDKWARIWIFIYLTGLPATLVTHTGDRIVTHTGDVLIGDSLVGGSISEADEELFTAIPREWSAAHIDKTTVVLLAGEAVLVGYPPRLVSDPPDTVTPANAPIIIELEA